jgi:hypothetical protein
MPDYRVIVSGSRAGGFRFRIEDVAEMRAVEHRALLDGCDVGIPLFVRHGAEEGAVAIGTSLENLRYQLTQMLAACNKPVLYLTQAELQEWR